MPCSPWKCVPIAISSDVDIPKDPGCHLLCQVSPQWGSRKLFQGFVSHELTTYLSDFYLFCHIFTILSKAHKPDNTKSHISLKLSFSNIQGLHSVFLDGYISLNKTIATFLLNVK